MIDGLNWNNASMHNMIVRKSQNSGSENNIYRVGNSHNSTNEHVWIQKVVGRDPQLEMEKYN